MFFKTLGALGILAWIAVAFLVNVLIVLLVWNAAGLHDVFGAGELTFIQAALVAFVLSWFGV